MCVMKLTTYRDLSLTGVVLMALALTTYAQSSGAPALQGAKATKKHSYTTSQSTQSAAQRQSSIYEAGSSAQVRHDRTGSLDPGHAKTGKKNVTGTGDNNQGQIGEP